jgi:hypothetical protein
VVLIVTDGLRWQEVFSGVERALIGPAGGVSDTTALLREFWRETAEERRAALLPFLWSTIAKEGQILGNPARQSRGTVTNGLKFSYPGYNEMILGAADPRINSNSYGPNPNITVFEWLNGKAGYKGKVAALATWGAFRDIFNADRSGVDVRAGWTAPFATPRGDRQALINELFRTSTRLWADNAFDVLTHQTLLEYVRTASACVVRRVRRDRRVGARGTLRPDPEIGATGGRVHRRVVGLDAIDAGLSWNHDIHHHHRPWARRRPGQLETTR